MVLASLVQDNPLGDTYHLQATALLTLISQYWILSILQVLQISYLILLNVQELHEPAGIHICVSCGDSPVWFAP